LVDVGCGTGYVVRTIKNLDKDKLGPTYLVGLDIFAPYFKDAKDVYDDVIQCDIRHLPLRDSSVEYFLATDVIEHLEKNEGLKFLSNLEAIATKQIVIVTPVGYELGANTFSNGNYYRLHRSGWCTDFFLSKGFKVFGVRGVRGLCSNEGILGCLLHYTARFLSQILIYRRPSAAFQMLCIKRFKVSKESTGL